MVGALHGAQRQQRYRAKLRAPLQAPPPVPPLDLQALDAEAIAVRILAAVPPEKADRIAAARNQRLVIWRVGSDDLRRRHLIDAGR
jgi:hypothetical protein